MLDGARIAAIVPALNEAHVIGQVVGELRALRANGEQLVDEVIVCDNGSTDNTALVAREAGASVVREPRRGYGSACQAGLKLLSLQQVSPDVVVFFDADRSASPNSLAALVLPLLADADLVVGVRPPNQSKLGAMKAPQKLGSRLVSALVRLIWQHPCTDFSPLRAVRYERLLQLDMYDRNVGWTVEMQVKAIQHEMAVIEVAAGMLGGRSKSKLWASLGSTLGAVFKMPGWVIYLALKDLLYLRWQRASPLIPH